MAEAQQGTAGATATGADAGQQAAAAAGSAGAGAAQTGQDDGFVRAPKAEYETAKANDGRFRQLQQRGDLDLLQHLQEQQLSAKELRETLDYLAKDLPAGVTVRDVLAAIRTPAQERREETAGNRAGGQRDQGQAGAEPPLTRAELVAALKEYDATKAQQTKQSQESQAVEQAEKDAETFWVDTAKELKIADGPKARGFKGIRQDAVLRVIAEDIQKADPLASAEDALKRADEFLPTKEQLTRAKALAIADWKDMGNEITSAAADGQAGYPAGTLGGGAGTAQTAGVFPRTQAQAMDAVIAQVKARIGKQ